MWWHRLTRQQTDTRDKAWKDEVEQRLGLLDAQVRILQARAELKDCRQNVSERRT